MKTQVLLITNEHVMRAGWTKLLSDHFESISLEFTDTIPDALSILTKKNADLIILCISYPYYTRDFQIVKMDLLDRNCPLMVYYAPSEFKTVTQYLKIGAAAGISYMESTDNIINAISTVLDGKRYICTSTEKLIMEQIFTFEPANIKRKSILSSREMEIAGYLTKGLRTSDIGKKLNLKVSTISTVKFKIFSKMKVTNVIQLVEKMKSV